MQKNQLKPNRDKKKNIETGILMGQNTNIFSQLSATFLQNKASNTQQQQQFLKNTQIIQYHDQNINRLISLLRKKAQVTKIKAVSQLHQQINKMKPTQIEEFIPTFANLYLQIILNEPSKQIVEGFVLIATDMLNKHKKIVVKQINTLYSPLLISLKISKVSSLLFTGSQQQMNQKALVLLMKKDVKKKFVVMMKIILECESKQKIQSANFQRNCASLMRVIKQIIKIYEQSAKAKELQQSFLQFLQEVNFSLQHECVQQYFKFGGKAKGSILQLYAALMSMCSRHNEWNLQWQRYAKIIGTNFLDKDLLVQQVLWKSCNKIWLEALITFNQKLKQGKQEQLNNLLNIYLPKPEEKIFIVLKLGGLSLYKQLANFCSIFPLTTILSSDNHKSLVNKLTFQRKLLTNILLSEDENQARIQCYYNIVELLLRRMRQFNFAALDQKKAKEIKSLCSKFQKQCVQNLQQRYYSDPPASKNYFSYYIPHYYSKIINQFHPTFDLKFNPQYTFSLYAEINSNQQNQGIIENIFENCKGNLSLSLKYLQIFPTRPIEVDMSQQNQQIQLAAKIYLLTSQPQQGKAWLQQNWDIRKKIIAYDPRINQRDFDNQEAEDDYYKPNNKNFPSKLYERPELDSFKFKFFMQQLLSNQDLSILKYLTPLINDILVARNSTFIDSLLELYSERCELLKKGKWGIGKHEVVIIRVISHIVIQYLSKSKGQPTANKDLVEMFLQNYCQFVRLMSNYKMQNEVEDLLKRINQLLPYEEYQQFIFKSCEKSVIIACQNTLLGGQKQQQKIRKNRLNKCIEFVNKLLWYCLLRNSQNLFEQLAKQFLTNLKNWQKAQTGYEAWILAHTLLQKLSQKSINNIIKSLVAQYQLNHHIILLILSCDNLLPLQAHKESRWKFSSLKKILQKQLFELEHEKLNNLLKIFMNKLFVTQNLQLVQGVKNLLSFIIIENQQNLNESLLDILKESCVVYPFKEYLNKLNIYKSLIYIGIISVIPLKKLTNIEYLYIQMCQRLHQSPLGLQYLQFTSICGIFWNKSIGLQQTIVIFKDVFAKAVQSYQKSDKSTSLAINYGIYSLFSLINTILPHIGQQFFNPYSQVIENLLWKQIEQGSDLYGLTQSVRMKFATRFIMSAGQKSKKKLIEQIPKIGRAEHLFYKKILLQIEQDQGELPHCDYIINLFIQLSEFLIRITSFLTQYTQPEQQIILQLIQCPFPALKKAAFLLLKTLYELKIVPRQPPKMYASLLNFELKPNDELTPNIFSSISTYLYTWQALLLRRQSTERNNINQQQINISLQQYIQNEGYSDLLIKNCFFILQDKLQYLKNQKDYEITIQQLMATDYELQLNQNHQIQQKLFKMAIQTLYLYIIHFPIFLRNFMDKNKKYKNICDRLLRNVISDGIFKEEVLKIEIMEHQWKADGNFDIFVTQKNKQIYAEYTHDVIRIGLRLVMRGNYPLTPIDIQFGQGLKMDQGSRLGLMLQNQLHNRNNTIINGILLWKQNIDKKLSGIEECAICFDIVNPTGQLPKKGCKTCKKKFHGNCIMKWFTKSNKSQCPLCKSQFL